MKAFRFLLLLASSAATAGTLQWVNPTTYTDGSALAAADISQTRIEYGSCNGTAFGTKTGEVKATGSATSAPIGWAPGTYCLRGYTTAKGVESLASAVFKSVIDQPAPNPPTGLTVVATVAYKMRQGIDGFSFVAIGTVPLGTACENQAADSYNIVPRASVKLASKFDTMPLIVFAQCG